MNLHAIVSGAIGTVNPHVPAVLQISTGWSVAAGSGGDRVPTYAAPVAVTAQVQALTFKDLQQIDGMNLQGTRRAIYLYGKVQGVNRVGNKGGDLITIAAGDAAGTWLVAEVLEQWPDWVKVACTQQQ
jgi:hypothetical protein